MRQFPLKCRLSRLRLLGKPKRLLGGFSDAPPPVFCRTQRTSPPPSRFQDRLCSLFPSHLEKPRSQRSIPVSILGRLSRDRFCRSPSLLGEPFHRRTFQRYLSERRLR